MKALWFSDLHIKEKNIDRVKLALDFILLTASNEKVDLLINTGDTFDTKNLLYGTELSVYRDFLIKATKIAPVISVVGNHDWCKEYDSHSLDGFRDIQGHTIVDSFLKFNDKVGFMAYCRTESRFNEMISNVADVDFLFGHFDMNSFDLGSGWEEKQNWSDPDKFKSFKKVLSGHYHLAQSKKIGETEITYVGTQYSSSFGESDQTKRLCVVDLETGDIKSIETGLCFHKTIQINAGDDIPQGNKNKLYETRVVISGTRAQLSEIKASKDGDIRLVKKSTEKTKTRIDFENVDKKSDQKILEEYVNYAKNMGSGKSLDAEKLIKLGESFLARTKV